MAKVVDRYRRRAWIAAIAVCGIVFIVLPSFSQVRTVLSAPLVVDDRNARGDACYVLCGGGALWERLDAAADLVQMGRVRRIILMRDERLSQYSFKTGSSWTRSQWISDYLAWRGIPPGKILWLQPAHGFFGTLAEARAVAVSLPKEVHTVIVVSSPPHMRRAVLAFKKSLAGRAAVLPYAATSIENSYELNLPIWIEYVKLVTYYGVLLR